MEKLEDHIEIKKGKMPKNLSELKGDKFNLPYVDIKAFEKNKIARYTDGAKCLICEADDILLVWDGARCGLVGKAIQGAVGSTLALIKPKPTIAKNYLFYFLQSLFQKLNTDVIGIGIPHLNPFVIRNSQLIIPPLPEQLLIVSKVEELLSDLENGKQQLQTAQQQLKVYRQSLLKWAFEGKLSQNHRLNGLTDDADFKTKHQKKSVQSEQSAKIRDSDNLNGELPKGWKNVVLKEIVEKISDGPFGSNLKSVDYVTEGIRVIRLENIGEMEFRNEYKTFVTPEKYETIKNHTVAKGDIIFSSFISESIRSVILPDYIEKAINKADCFLVRVSESKINKKYLAYYFSTRAMQNQLVSQIHGATRPRINTTQLKASLIPIPSLQQQQLIVDELESKLTVCDKIEETITNSLQQAELLKQSILKKAFEGKLINYELRIENYENEKR